MRVREYEPSHLQGCSLLPHKNGTHPPHTRTHHEAQIGHKGHCSLLWGSSYNHLDLHNDTLIPLSPYPLSSPFAMLRSRASIVRSPSLLLPVPFPCPAFPIFRPWHHMHDGGGTDDDHCRYVVLLCVWVCVCVLACVCRCAHAHVRKCRWFVCSWFLSLSMLFNVCVPFCSPKFLPPCNCYVLGLLQLTVLQSRTLVPYGLNAICYYHNYHKCCTCCSGRCLCTYSQRAYRKYSTW